MQSTTKKVVLIGCSGLGVVLVFAAVFVAWFVFSAVETVNNHLTGGYKVSGGKVYYYKTAIGFTISQSWEVEGADPASLKVIDDDYATDKNQAYFEGVGITGSSSRNFRVIQKPYAADQDHVFYRQRSFSDAPGQFKIYQSADELSTDGINVYIGANALFPGQIDAATFEHIGETPYFKDKNLVMTAERIVQGADPSTFEVIPDYKGVYAKDKASVFYNGIKVPGCDPATFQIIDSTMHRDAHHVYERGTKLNDDAANFKALDCNFTKDSKKVYWKFIPLEGANAAKFKTLNCDGYGVGYGSDGKNVYWCNLKFDGADQSTLVGLSGHYAKDKNHVWYGHDPDKQPQTVENADPASFELTVVAADEGQDKNNSFRSGDLTGPRR